MKTMLSQKRNPDLSGKTKNPSIPSNLHKEKKHKKRKRKKTVRISPSFRIAMNSKYQPVLSDCAVEDIPAIAASFNHRGFLKLASFVCLLIAIIVSLNSPKAKANNVTLESTIISKQLNHFN